MGIVKKVLHTIYGWFTPWSFWASYIFFPTKMFFRRMGIGSKYYKKICEIKNVHLGQRCFIIATGPSLSIEDVNMLKDEITIGENSIFRWYKDMKWIPTYYVMTDPSLTKRIIKENDRLDFNNFARCKCIFNSINRRQIECDKAIYVDCNWLDHIYHYGVSRRFKYNPDPQYGVYDCYSVTQECILYAIYMGIKEIYILGADNDYLGKKQHFTSYGGERKIEYEAAIKMQKANDLGYEFVKTVAENEGVKIYNATRGGNIKCFERVKLENLIKI